MERKDDARRDRQSSEERRVASCGPVGAWGGGGRHTAYILPTASLAWRSSSVNLWLVRRGVVVVDIVDYNYRYGYVKVMYI